MIRQVVLILILAFLLSACGGAAPVTEAPAPEEPPVATEEPTQSLIANTNTPVNTSTPVPTDTPAATPTDTPLPTLELPTEIVNAPQRLVWDGTPTYLGDSTPGYSFRLSYAPELWALTIDQFGFPALGHRILQGCVISITSGRGLPPSMTVEHDFLQVENVFFDMGTAYENGEKKFVTFTGGDGTVITAFEVSFQQESDACLTDAVTVLSTLESVPVSQATPAP